LGRFGTSCFIFDNAISKLYY